MRMTRGRSASKGTKANANVIINNRSPRKKISKSPSPPNRKSPVKLRESPRIKKRRVVEEEDLHLKYMLA